MEQIKAFFEKAQAWASANKSTLVKAGAAVAGAIIGAVVVGLVTSDEDMDSEVIDADEDLLDGEEPDELESDEE